MSDLTSKEYQFKVDTKSLKAALKKLSFLFSIKKNCLPIFKHCLLEIANSSVVITIINNDNNSYTFMKISIPVQVEDNDTLSFCIPFKEFKEITKSSKSPYLSFRTKGESILIRDFETVFTINILPSSNFPVHPTVDDTSICFNISTDILMDGLTVAYAQAQNDVRYYLNGIWIESKKENLVFVATDGYRLAIIEKSVDTPRGFKFLLPGTVAKSLPKVLSGSSLIKTTLCLAPDVEDHTLMAVNRTVIEGTIIFSSDNWEVSTRIKNQHYPFYQEVIPRIQSDAAVNCCMSELQKAEVLHNIKLINANGVKLSFRKDTLEIKLEDSIFLTMVLPISTNTDNTDINIGVNIKYLKDVLLLPGSINIQVTSSLDSILFWNQYYKAVVMPMRLR